jgi:hypothetical protein
VLPLLGGGGVRPALATPSAAVELVPSAIIFLPYPILLWSFVTRDRVVSSMTHRRGGAADDDRDVR